MQNILILGCGFTGERVATQFIAQGDAVTVTSRSPTRLHQLRQLGARAIEFDVDPTQPKLPKCISVVSWDAILYSIPTLRVGDLLIEPAPTLAQSLCTLAPRAIYLSTTGVYGHQTQIDATTLPLPRTPREQLRVDAENAVLQSFASPLVLRPAAIYGPGRGVHVSLRQGRYRLTGSGDNYISRIYVDDLAAHVAAALHHPITGAWPVADALPCTQLEMASYCASLLGVPLPPSIPPAENAESLRANRRVDGSAIRKALRIGLRFPSYREGVAAALQAEQSAARDSENTTFATKG